MTKAEELQLGTDLAQYFDDLCICGHRRAAHIEPTAEFTTADCTKCFCQNFTKETPHE